jgi:hypothetical protein
MIHVGTSFFCGHHIIDNVMPPTFISPAVRRVMRLAAVACVLGIAERATASPFVDKPCESYSSPRDEKGRVVPLVWGEAPLDDYGSREVAFDRAGVRPLRPAPPPGVHPRIFFGPDDLADVRRRIRETRCGREAWKNILSWTAAMKGDYDDTADYAMPDRWKGSFQGLHGRVPLYRLGVPVDREAGYGRSSRARAIYEALVDGSAEEFPEFFWHVFPLEAFRCLVDDDSEAAEKLARAVVTAVKLGQAKRAADRADRQAKKPDVPLPPPAQPVGGHQLAFCYDFLHGRLSSEQRRIIQDELAECSWSHDNYGTFNTAETSRSNWATFSYWLWPVLALEGEPGCNDLKVRGIYRGWRNLLTYGWYPSGATFEGEAKNQLGMDGVIAFARRTATYGVEDLCGHPHLRAYARNFLPHSRNAMLNGFHLYDLLGTSRGRGAGFTPMDALGLKFMFPDDPVIDWSFRQAVGEDYEHVPDRPDGYYNGLLFYAIFASDFDPANNDPARLGLGHTFFCGERALLMTRSGWDREAAQLNLHVRQANGGHAFADRNAIMLAGAGRIWSPNGGRNFSTTQNSVVAIDGASQQLAVPGRMVDVVDEPLATFAVGDAAPCWSWNWKTLRNPAEFYTLADVREGRVAVPEGWEPERRSPNDFAFTKRDDDYLRHPMFELGDWLLPKGAVSPVVRQPHRPVRKAWRTAGLVRGTHPYALLVDDIQQDDAVHRYDWTLTLEYDVQIATVEERDGMVDILLTGHDPDQTKPHSKDPLPEHLAADASPADGNPMLLVRVIDVRRAPGTSVEPPTIRMLPDATNPKNKTLVRGLVIPVDAIAPEFKVLLVPHRRGTALPRTTWDAARKTVTISWDGQEDAVAFAAAPSGKTDLLIRRGGETLVHVRRPVHPL